MFQIGLVQQNSQSGMAGEGSTTLPEFGMTFGSMDLMASSGMAFSMETTPKSVTASEPKKGG